ncbi:MAG: FecR family protein [Sphingobacterium sp.]|nr:FecR family protein [Sphingobacterium sp.]
MQDERLHYLLTHYFRNTISRLELKEMLDRLDDLNESDFSSLFERMEEEIPVRSELFDRDSVMEQLSLYIAEGNEESSYNKRSRMNYVKWGSVAATAVLFCFAFLYLVTRKEQLTEQPRPFLSNDIALPEGNTPTLTLSTGEQYSISADNPESLSKGNLTIIKDNDGTLRYQLKHSENSSEKRTFHSPKGSALKLQLIDGTTVHLNSGSSLTYPVHFETTNRIVFLDGEAYFDVAHDPTKPFIVETKQTRIKVLGTQFNVSSDLTKMKTLTTLIKGRVEVSVGNNHKILVPGMQAQSDPQQQQIVLKQADLKEILAWRDGFFRFTEDDIETVLQKVKEWYDIREIKIQSPSKDHFTGMVKRTKKLSDLFGQLEKISNYKFKIQDGRVLVM